MGTIDRLPEAKASLNSIVDRIAADDLPAAPVSKVRRDRMRFELEPFHRDVPDDDLLASLKIAYAKATAAGKALTFRTYREVGQYHPSTIVARFGTWNEALQRAGLPLNEEKGVPIKVLFDNLKQVWIAKGKQPVYRDMNAPPSEYAASTYNARFGGCAPPSRNSWQRWLMKNSFLRKKWQPARYRQRPASPL